MGSVEEHQARLDSIHLQSPNTEERIEMHLTVIGDVLVDILRELRAERATPGGGEGDG